MTSFILNVGIFLFAEEQRYKPCPEGYLSTRHKFFMQRKIMCLFFICIFLSVKRILKSPESDLLKVHGLPRFDCLVIPYYYDGNVIPHSIFQTSCQFCLALSDMSPFFLRGLLLSTVSSGTATAGRKIPPKFMNRELQRIFFLLAHK